MMQKFKFIFKYNGFKMVKDETGKKKFVTTRK